MTSVVAALIALGAGVAVAALLYFKRSAESRWDLALLRFIWVGLLVYALLSPEKLTQNQRKVRPVLTVLLDSSKSLGVDVDSLSAAALQRFEALGFEPILREFDPARIPSNVRWAYVGDGHIENIEATSQPEFYLLAKAKPLQPLSLLQGIAVPERVLQGSAFHAEVLASSEADISVVFNGKKYEGSSFDLKAPVRAGAHPLLAVARSSGRTDSLKTTVVVQESLATVVVASNAPHPHEGMIRRWCKSQGIDVLSLRWNELDRVASFKGPLITLGGGEAAIAKLLEKVDVPMLHLDAGIGPAFIEQDQLSEVFGMKNIEVYANRKQPQLIVAPSIIDARGIHWYKSGLASQAALDAFEALLEELMQRYEPAQLRIVHGQQVAVGQRVKITGAVVNSRLEVLPADFQIDIKHQGQLVEQLSLKYSARSAQGTFSPSLPGIFQIHSRANWSGGVLERSTTLQVIDVDVELVRERNESLISLWKQAGVQEAITAQEKVAPSLISFEKKNPQHLHWWYWGLALLAAAFEWSLRRRSGLI